MSNNRTTELLPCPFCGGEASKRLFYGARYGVYCDECDARVGGLFNTEAEAIAAWNARAERGTLTAEQVEKAIHDCSTYASYDGCTYYASGIRLQAIADELNAALGGGECELTLDGTDGNFGCSECLENIPPLANFCPNCGKAVKR